MIEQFTLHKNTDVVTKEEKERIFNYPDATVDKEQRVEIAKRLVTPTGDDPEALFEGPLSFEDVYARILALQAKVRREEII